MGLFDDADAFLAEQAAEPLVIRNLFGRDWELPGSPPAEAMFRQARVAAAFARLQRSGKLDGLTDDDDVPEELLGMLDFDPEEHAAALVGADNLAVWRAEGVTQAQLQAILGEVQQHHQGGGRPNRAARRAAGRETKESASTTSSSNGRRSKPTSPASTGST